MAAVGGGGPFLGDACQAPIAAMIIHGTTDDVVPLGEGEASRDRWVSENGCASTGTTWIPDDPDGLPTECIDYDGCGAGTPTTWCTFDTGHTWRAWMNEAIVSFLTGA
jgi:poly(3-hydroxybutyrate) depolymerase